MSVAKWLVLTAHDCFTTTSTTTVLVLELKTCLAVWLDTARMLDSVGKERDASVCLYLTKLIS